MFQEEQIILKIVLKIEKLERESLKYQHCLYLSAFLPFALFQLYIA